MFFHYSALINARWDGVVLMQLEGMTKLTFMPSRCPQKGETCY